MMDTMKVSSVPMVIERGKESASSMRKETTSYTKDIGCQVNSSLRSLISRACQMEMAEQSIKTEACSPENSRMGSAKAMVNS